MVLFVDLDTAEQGAAFTAEESGWTRDVLRDLNKPPTTLSRVRDEPSRDNPNKNVFTDALACYPIIISIASHIDLNTLDALSLTCRQTRVNLLQFRAQLINATLRCAYDDAVTDRKHVLRYRARASDIDIAEQCRLSKGAVGKNANCARDMVDGCRRCGTVVCRNCIIKPPAPMLCPNRHRRICKACSKAPLDILISHTEFVPSSPPSTPPREYSAMTLQTKSQCTTFTPTSIASTLPTIRLAICTCPMTVWLCQPCGRSLRSDDEEYRSIWQWRARYFESLGGLGVGIGDADRGVCCGRGAACIAAREVEHEVDCDAEDAREIKSGSLQNCSSGKVATGFTKGFGNGTGVGFGSAWLMGTGHKNSNGNGNGNGLGTPGYERHEIEGIGGVLKKKLVKMVPVGACVPEYEDEKDVGSILMMEKEGRRRSWCGWCSRVVPSSNDLLALALGKH